MTSRPNAQRRAKMRTICLSDAAWDELARRAGPGGSRSATIEAWLTDRRRSVAPPADHPAPHRGK